jgi:hypothetical protein
MKIDRNDPGSHALRLQTVDQYILFVELANEKYIQKPVYSNWFDRSASMK